MHTPLITGSDCEGAGEMFQVTTMDLNNVPKTADGKVDYTQDFFGKPTNLTVSGQLNGETYAMAFKNIYTFGPTFRAENSNTTRHAAEFWMIEPEIAFADLEDDMILAESMLKYVINYVLENAPEEMAFFNNFVDKGLLDRLHNVVNNDFARVTYTEAVEILSKHNDKFDYTTELVRIDLDKAREDDIRNGKGFIIDEPKSIKKDIKLQDGIFSNRYGSTLSDDDSFIDRYRCDCGLTRGSINHGEISPSCGTMVKYKDDDMSIFGWIVLKKYCVIHPNLYRSLEAFIGPNRLNKIIEPDIQVNSYGIEIEIPPETRKKDEIFSGIGIPGFQERFEEIMNYYL